MSYTQRMKTEDKDYIEINPCENGVKMEISSYNFKISTSLTPHECKELRKLLQAGITQFNKREKERYRD